MVACFSKDSEGIPAICNSSPYKLKPGDSDPPLPFYHVILFRILKSLGSDHIYRKGLNKAVNTTGGRVHQGSPDNLCATCL